MPPWSQACAWHRRKQQWMRRPLTWKNSKSNRDFREPYCLAGNFVSAGAQLIHTRESTSEGGRGRLGTCAQGRFWKMCWVAESLKMCLDLASKRLNIRRQGGGFYSLPRIEAEAWSCRDPLCSWNRWTLTYGPQGAKRGFNTFILLPCTQQPAPSVLFPSLILENSGD